MVGENHNQKRTSWTQLAAASAAGAAAAVIIGFALSLIAAWLGLGILRPSETAADLSFNKTLARAGINLLISHRAAIVGGSTTNWLVISWPLTLWAIIPAASLLVGGYLCSVIISRRAGNKFAVGASTAIPYTMFLLIMRPFCAVLSSSVQLPNLPAKGVEFDFNLLPTAIKLYSSLGDVIIMGLVFGILFGGLGASRGWAKLLSPEVIKSSWIRGALAALFFGYLTMSVIAFGITAVTSRWTSVDLIPAVAGNFYGMAHGASLKVIRSNTVSSNGSSSEGGSTEFESKSVMTPAAILALGIIPAFWLLAGGSAAAAGSGKSPFIASAKMAAFYALCLTAVSPLFSFVLSQINTAGGVPVKTTVTLSLAPAQIFIGSLIIALVFGTLGAFWSLSRANS